MRIFEGFNLNSKGIYAVFLLHSSLSEVVWIIYKKRIDQYDFIVTYGDA